MPHQTLGQRLAEGTAASPPTGFFPGPYEAVRRSAGPILKAGPRPVPAGAVGAILRDTRVGVWCGGAAWHARPVASWGWRCHVSIPNGAPPSTPGVPKCPPPGSKPTPNHGTHGSLGLPLITLPAPYRPAGQTGAPHGPQGGGTGRGGQPCPCLSLFVPPPWGQAGGDPSACPPGWGRGYRGGVFAAGVAPGGWGVPPPQFGGYFWGGSPLLLAFHGWGGLGCA